MSDRSRHALDSIDHFVAAATDIARLPLFQKERYAAAAADLYEIAQRLLVANENMSRWMNRFLHFDFRRQDARSRFLELLETYRTAKVGPEFRALKFSCGDIWVIYHRNIAGTIEELYDDDVAARRHAEAAFMELGSADGMMVDFIRGAVVGAIDAFVAEAERHVDRSDLNFAESARLTFKTQSADLSRRLERFDRDLTDLVLVFARLAGRPVTLG